MTRVEHSDSKASKRVNALLWAGLGDPFALTAFDWCQNTDHFCAKCDGHLAHKPYKCQTQVIPESSTSELPMGGYYEKTELPANPNQVLELSGDQAFALQREVPKESVAGSQSSQFHSSRILSPTELDWEVYQPSLSSDESAIALTGDNQTEPLELPTARDQINAELPHQRYRDLPELASSHTIKRKPVEMGTGRLRSTEVRGQTTLPREPKETEHEA